ncbi:condensation domain-containing protein, partial [Staphylococcus caprae]|uniref:condensation domain-containing protein n=1 Tax=Staphylococcus caprae TaxID=29380 RepID=UPI003B20F7A7
MIDGVSWRILYEDLINSINNYLAGEPIQLPIKTTSFKEYSEKLKQYQKSNIDQDIKAYWLNIIDELDADNFKGETKVKQEDEIIFNEEETEYITEVLPQQFKATIEEILLAAFLLEINNHTEKTKVWITMEGHGREDFDETVDINRTVGWFTTMYPVGFELKNDFVEMLKEVKLRLRTVPHKGFEYGLVKNGNSEIIEPDISFNYLGKIKTDKHSKLQLINTNSNSINDKNKLDTMVTSIVDDGELKIIFNGYYNFKMTMFEELLNFKCEEELPLNSYVKSDFPYADIKNNDLSSDISISNGATLANTTPLQEGIILHSYENNYRSSFKIKLNESINYENFLTSLLLLTKEFDVLRTKFIKLNNGKEYLMVNSTPSVNCDLVEGDNFENNSDELWKFEISMNKKIVQFTHHHALLDGWSVTLLLNRLNEIYFEVQENNYKDRNAPQFLGYINWLNNQNKSEAKHYWNQKIDSLQSPTLIKKQNSINKSKFKQYNFKLEKDISHKIKQVVKNNRWTMNDLIQTIWAITLSCVIGKNNFSYGIVSSGRNPEIDRVGEIAGLFINTIPQVIDLKKHKKFKDLIEYIKMSQNESQKYEYLSLTEIKRNSHLKNSKELFNTLFVFENYPELNAKVKTFFEIIQGHEQAHYPLVFSAGYKNELICKISYNQEYLSKKQVESIEKIFKFYAEKLSKEIDLPIENTKYEHKQNEIFGQSTSSKLSLKSKFYNTSRQNHNKVAIKNQNISLTYKQLNNIILNNIKKINENYDINKINTIGIQYSRGVKAIIGMLTATILKIPY